MDLEGHNCKDTIFIKIKSTKRYKTYGTILKKEN